MNRKVMTKSDYTDLTVSLGAAKVLESIAEGLMMADSMGILDLKVAMTTITRVHDDIVRKAVNDMVTKGLLDNEEESFSVEDVINNSIVMEDIR